MQITIEKINGVSYYKMESRGVAYTIYFQETVGEWCVFSRRKSLGRLNMGTSRYFKTLADVEKKIKGLAGISSLLETTVSVQA